MGSVMEPIWDGDVSAIGMAVWASSLALPLGSRAIAYEARQLPSPLRHPRLVPGSTPRRGERLDSTPFSRGPVNPGTSPG